MKLEEYAAAGLYDPDDPKAAERRDLLAWCEKQGFSLDEMRLAHSRGSLEYIATLSVVRPGPFLTQSELSERLGVPHEVLEAFRVAFALPPVADGEPWCNEREAEMFEAVAEGVQLFGMSGMERLSRVIGASVSRIAETMASTNSERLRRMAQGGATEAGLAEANLSAVRTADAPARIVSGLLALHLQLAAARLRGSRTGPMADTIHGCVGFVDLVGSTTLSRGLSTRELSAMVDRFEEVAHRVAVNRRGRIVKFIGDEVMFVTTTANAACDIALALVEAFAGDPAITPRGGVAEGELIDLSGDYYGPVVNLAARLGELAVPREILVPADMEPNISREKFGCESAGRRMLRGFDAPVALMSIARA